MGRFLAHSGCPGGDAGLLPDGGQPGHAPPGLPKAEQQRRKQCQIAGRGAAQEQRAKTNDGIEQQDVSIPQQREVQQAEQGQPQQAAHLQAGAASTGGLLALDEQDQARPEQDREQRPHLSFEEHEGEGKGPMIGGAPGGGDVG